MSLVRTAPGAVAVPATDDPRPDPLWIVPDPVTDPAPRGPRPGRIASDRDATVGLDVLDLLLPWLLGGATLTARLATAASGPTDWDSAQFAAAVGHYDVAHGRPQPPGYYLYVVAGRLVHDIGPGVIQSLVLAAAVASAIAVGLTVVAGRDLGGRWVGLAAGLLVATSPFAWYSGSIVTTYSFDLLAAPLLVILAWRARPHSWHGVAAVAALGLIAGFRQSAVLAFALLALLAVLGSVRRTREALFVLAAGVASVAVWFVPMALAQPGGVRAWARATHLQYTGVARASSVLDHAAGASVNLGTFAAYTTVALAPLAVLAVLSFCVLAVRGLARRVGGRRARSPRDRSGAIEGGAGTEPLLLPPNLARGNNRGQHRGQHRGRGRTGPVPVPVTVVADAGAWSRPWYQSRVAILAAAVLPPMAVVALVAFAKGGYLLAYLPGAVIALLLVPATVLGRPGGGPRARRTIPGKVWLVTASLCVLAIAAFGSQRFLDGSGVLPVSPTSGTNGLWLVQARFQAPYIDTRPAIRAADGIDAGLARIGPLVDPARDVVVIDSLDGGIAFYRSAGWELPRDRVALVTPDAAIYNEQFGSLYYTLARTVPVGRGGAVYLVAPSDLLGLPSLVAQGKAVPVPGARPFAGYRLWKVSPGTDILGVQVVSVAGHRPLGHGLG